MRGGERGSYFYNRVDRSVCSLPPDTRVGKDAAVSPRNIPSSSTRDVCNARQPDRREETAFRLHVTNSTPGPLVHQTSPKTGTSCLVLSQLDSASFKTGERVSTPVLGTPEASIQGSSYKALACFPDEHPCT